MANHLQGRRVAILVTDGFEQVELTDPKQALMDEGAQVEVIAPKSGSLRAWKHTDWGDSFEVNRALDDANPGDYDALLLPGGVLNPDSLRKDQRAVDFTRAFVEAGKPIASICHGPWLLINAGAVKGRRMTSYESLEADLKNAGANWVDEEVVVDGGLVTSRRPDDLPAFNKAMVEAFAA